MAAGRGLNKGRGLGSLIPPKVINSVPETADSKKPGVKKTTTDSGTGNPKKAGSTDTKKKEKHESIAEIREKESAEDIISVRITEVVPNREQPRKHFDEASLEELAGSIREHGIITPLLVQKKGRYYELIAGERRWRAAKLAGLKEVPVILRSFSEEQAAEIALIENIQRENLNAMEEAQAFKRLQDEFSLKQEDIAKRVSRSRSAITNSLRLLKLEEHVQNMVAEGRLSMGHARALLSLENPELQRITAEQVAENDLSVRDTEKMVRHMMSPKKTGKPRTGNEQLEAVYHDLEEQLRKSIGTRVSILPIRGKKGKIEIEYYSDEDLERIIDRLRQS